METAITIGRYVAKQKAKGGNWFIYEGQGKHYNEGFTVGGALNPGACSIDSEEGARKVLHCLTIFNPKIEVDWSTKFWALMRMFQQVEKRLEKIEKQLKESPNVTNN